MFCYRTLITHPLSSTSLVDLCIGLWVQTFCQCSPFQWYGALLRKLRLDPVDEPCFRAVVLPFTRDLAGIFEESVHVDAFSDQLLRHIFDEIFRRYPEQHEILGIRYSRYHNVYLSKRKDAFEGSEHQMLDAQGLNFMYLETLSCLLSHSLLVSLSLFLSPSMKVSD